MTDFPLTFRCNNNCVSCIIRYDIVERFHDPDLKQIKDVICNIDPINDYIGFTGGEPTIRKEFFEILKYARKVNPNLYIFILTNGRMFAYKDFAKRLADLKLGNYRVAVSIYGHTPEMHDKITRCKNSFKQTIEGIKNLLSFKIPLEIRVVINKMNYQYLEDVAKFISKNFSGSERIVFTNMKITGNAYKNIDDVFVRYAELVSHLEKAVEVLNKNNMNTFLYHFPLCTIPNNLWKISEGITKSEKFELTFVDGCDDCKMKNKCPMIWKTYVLSAGKDEFKPIY